ncbi:MAG: UDP-3-O-(3-hydroxymyristoyl)glucosamine N-acyltransferase [Flavobacteriales bacterium]|nr:MAG: UDP-3-O-(3-hydroxymyristoyl)glucosamine N-acyltransferase [Flavobacteriales bacterium]
MEFTAQQLADLLGGEVEGNPNTTVNKLAKIEEGEPRSIAFLANEKYTEYIYTTDASIVIVNKSFKIEKPLKNGCTLIRVQDARIGFSKLLDAYNQNNLAKTGIHPQAFIAETARLGEHVYAGAFSYIGENVHIGNNVEIFPNSYIGDNAKIGDNTVLKAGAKIYTNCEIGASCMLHSGVVIGSDGFGFTPNKENDYQKVPHTGNVVVEDHVEIGANTTIDRATLGSTIIRKGVKLDNLIQIAHNVEIGENTVIAAQTGVAGSAKIGRDCMIGGQVGIAGHVTIADGVKIQAQSGINRSIEQKGAVVQGSPAFSINEFRRSYVIFKKLPKLKQIIDKIEKELSSLKQMSL